MALVQEVPQHQRAHMHWGGAVQWCRCHLGVGCQKAPLLQFAKRWTCLVMCSGTTNLLPVSYTISVFAAAQVVPTPSPLQDWVAPLVQGEPSLVAACYPSPPPPGVA